MKTFLFRSILGIFFGAFIAVLTTNAFVYSGEQSLLDGELFMKNSLGSLFCGWLFTVTPLFFEVRSLNLLQQTALHFVTVTILYSILALGIGWVPFHTESVLLFLVISILTYVIFWISFYLYFKNESKKMNEQLKHID